MDSSAPTPPAAPLLPPSSHDLEVTIISAKHLKNVNWRSGGELKPYAVAYLRSACRSATKADDSGNTRPVWNERLSLPLPPSFSSVYDEDGGADDPSARLLLTIDVFHSKPSETPKPLVGTAQSALRDLLESPASIKTLELRCPSGRPQGKIRIKVAIRERPSFPPDSNYSRFPSSPHSSGYYSVPPPPPPYSPCPRSIGDYRTYSPPRRSIGDYRTYSPPPLPFPPIYGGHHHSVPPQPPHYSYGSYSDQYPPRYYSYPLGYYAASASDRPYYERASGYGVPSAPSDYSTEISSPPAAAPSYKARGGKTGFGTGLAVGAVAGTLRNLSLEEGKKH